MDDKYYIVLKKLIDTEDQAITAKEIADGLNVSVRTIFRYVNVINQLDDKESFRVVSIKNKGLMLRILNKTDFDAFLESMDNDQQLTEQQIEFLEMIIMSEPTEAEVANVLSYSVSSINRLINDLNNKLMNRRMNICKCKGKILMDGSEVQIRNFMQYLWSSYPSTEEFFLHNSRNAYLRFKSYADQIGIDEDIVSYIYILMERFNHVHSIVFSQIITGLFKNNDADNNKAQKIENYYQNNYGSNLSKNEIIFIQLILTSRKDNGQKYSDSSNTFIPIINNILSQIDAKYGTAFKDDDELINSICCHVAGNIVNYVLQKNTNNQLIDQIRLNFTNDHVYAIDMANSLSEMLGISISDDDIGYFTLHFATSDERMHHGKEIPTVILYKKNLTTAKLLSLRLSEEFHEINMLGTYQVNNASDFNKDGKKLIFVCEEELNGEGLLLVNPFITNDDEILIRKAILRIKGLNPFIRLCHNDCFYIFDSVKSKIELLDYLTNDLTVKGYMSSQDAINTLNREKLSSTEISQNVAFPHCLIESESFLAVAILKQPLRWQTHHVRLVLLMGLNKKDIKNKEAIRFLFDGISSAEKINMLLNTKNIDEFIATVKE